MIPDSPPSEKIEADLPSSGQNDMSVSQVVPSPSTVLDVNNLMALVGPGPVLRTESSEFYRQMLTHYLKDLEPKDFLQQMWIKHLADVEWESLRVRRHKALAIERREQAWRELKSARAKKVEDRKSEKETEQTAQTNEDKVFALSWNVHVIKDNVMEIADSYTELDASRAMERAMDYYEKLEKLEQDCLAKRERILAEIRLYDEILYLRAKHYRLEEKQQAPELLEDKNETDGKDNKAD